MCSAVQFVEVVDRVPAVSCCFRTAGLHVEHLEPYIQISRRSIDEFVRTSSDLIAIGISFQELQRYMLRLDTGRPLTLIIQAKQDI